MDETIFDKIISFSSNYFELFLYTNGSLFVLFLIVAIALRLNDISFWTIFNFVIKSILCVILVIGQFILVIVCGYLYWENYKRPAPELNLAHDVLASTQWIKDNTRVYFIDDNALRSVEINGRNAEDVFLGDDPVREYHFSPDGKHLIILTQKDLFLLDRDTKNSRKVDTLGKLIGQDKKGGNAIIRGSVSGIQWASDSQKFVYEMSRWSEFASQNSVYFYNIKNHQKRAIKSPTRRISSLYWDQQSENLYYLYHEAQDTSLHLPAFEVKVFRIPLVTLVPELVAQISTKKLSIPVESLSFRNIELFLDEGKFSFGRPGRENDLVSEKGASLGIDENDYLYFIASKWFRKRLHKIPRELRDTDVSRYQYNEGGLVVDHIRWIPGGRYVIMEHRYWGVLILEPSTGKIGLLIRANGHSFGWYQKGKG